MKLNDFYEIRNLKTGLNDFFYQFLEFLSGQCHVFVEAPNRMEDNQTGPHFDIKLYIVDKVHVDKNVDNTHCSLKARPQLKDCICLGGNFSILSLP